MPHAVEVKQSRAHYNNSVPVGHRTKCRKCGAVDKTQLMGFPQKVRCADCGGTVARRRAKRVPKVISFVVNYQCDGENMKPTPHHDRFAAEQAAITFVERGSVARTRIAQVVELCDGSRTGNIGTLRYDNYRQRTVSIEWVSGCEACKGKGLISVRIPVKADEPSRYRLVACVSCSGLGGELTRKMSFGRGVK